MVVSINIFRSLCFALLCFALLCFAHTFDRLVALVALVVAPSRRINQSIGTSNRSRFSASGENVLRDLVYPERQQQRAFDCGAKSLSQAKSC